MLVVTTDSVPGYHVRQVLGEVIGVTGRTRNPFQERVRMLDGGGNPKVVQVLTRYRLDAVQAMIEHARRLGANAIVGMRFDTRYVTGMSSVRCAYGTGVFVVEVSCPRAYHDPSPLTADAAMSTAQSD